MVDCDITGLLNRVVAGDRSAEDQLVPHVYKELKRIANRYLLREGDGHTLQATALVHEAYLKLVRGHQRGWQDRSHFFAVAARIMRHILVDHARGKSARKRGGSVHIVPLDDCVVVGEGNAKLLIDLNDALERLEALDRRQAKVVEMRFFGGMTEEEIAGYFGVSARTVKRDWRMARAWLYGELSG